MVLSPCCRGRYLRKSQRTDGPCRTIQGDYEICPRNPIVTHRHMPLLNPISVTGHADIVETQNGEWWMVLLAVRPL